jgi:sulfur-carrier protein
MSAIVRVELPTHLCVLADIRSATREVQVAVQTARGEQVTQRAVLDALEAAYPMLQGTIRDHTSKLRRPFMRFFACEQDLSHLSPDDELPDTVAQGVEPLLVVGAIAGG